MILVVIGDSKIRSTIIKKVIKPLGYDALIAADEIIGLELALTKQPELVLFDGSFTTLSSGSLIPVLHQSNNSTPIILVSEKKCDDLVEAYRQGVSDHITLPLEVENAQQVVTRVIQNLKEARERQSRNQKLIQEEAVRITMTTLSHYLKNYLTALDGDLMLLHESILSRDPLESQLKIQKKCRRDSAYIKTVIEVLINTTSIKFKEYDNSSTMIDIDELIFNEINLMLDSGASDNNDI